MHITSRLLSIVELCRSGGADPQSPNQLHIPPVQDLLRIFVDNTACKDPESDQCRDKEGYRPLSRFQHVATSKAYISYGRIALDFDSHGTSDRPDITTNTDYILDRQTETATSYC
jgi:hypothetical protein